MGVGKYSPTVHHWYSKDQTWHDRHKDNPAEDWYDRDGYDQYGYHKDTDLDRAGYSELDYLEDGKWEDIEDGDEIRSEYVNHLHDYVDSMWRSAPYPWEK